MAEIADDIRAANARKIEQLCRNTARDVLANDFQKLLLSSIELPMPSVQLSQWVRVGARAYVCVFKCVCVCACVSECACGV